jgi:hypothetical protein
VRAKGTIDWLRSSSNPKPEAQDKDDKRDFIIRAEKELHEMQKEMHDINRALRLRGNRGIMIE